MFIKLFAIVLVISLLSITFINCMAVKYDSGTPVEEPIAKASNSTWLSRTLSRAGSVAGEVGNALGSTGIQLTTTAERICDLVKKILPIIAAICHVGQFRFCAPVTAKSAYPALPEGDFTNYDKLD